ncbi:ATP-dependent DNA helicase [Caerostris darwini]|uniref:ATP-dependent DNA helicase n=1 Tax=Caerostris darwini TaxID=1538125 RepID=A0AAV4UVD4_9ARAC|nr:ATP-dependent DNA helicase [Caerostris darwini]
MDTTMDNCKHCLTNVSNMNMNSDILLLSETWTILRDTFELNGFDHHHLVSDLSWRRPSGVSIYIKRHLKPLVESVEMFSNQNLGIHVLVANFKTKVHGAVLYAKPASSDADITDAINESLDGKNRDYKIVLAGDFNIDMGTERRREFCKIMDEIYYMTLRNNIHTINITYIHTIYNESSDEHSCSVFNTQRKNMWPVIIAFSVITCVYTFKSPREKQDFVRPIHQKTMIQGRSVGPIHGILQHKLTGKVMMMDIHCSIVSNRCQSTVGLRISNLSCVNMIS